MPFVEVHHLEGRTEDQRQKLAQAITEAVAEIFKVPTDSVWVKFSEMPKSYFATGGILKSRR